MLWFYPFLRLRSRRSVLVKAVFMTMMALPRPIEPKSARKMSELEKIDQVCIGCFVTEFSIAPSSRKAKGGQPA